MVTRLSERGAALFVVVLVLTLLAAIGVFAAKASGIGELTAGYERQNTQNHYVAEYGMLAAQAELGHNATQYDWWIADGGEPCAINRNVDGGAYRPSCYKLKAANAQDRLPAGRVLFQEGGVAAPGSFGPSDVMGDFEVQMTDLGPAPDAVVGSNVGEAKTFHYRQVTLTSAGQVRPTPVGACDPGATVVQGTDTVRAHVTFGPVDPTAP